jgi:ribosomal-protein-alanine N-acetyltransferase
MPPSLTTRLTSERLVLRPPRTTDVTELRRLLRKNSAHLAPWSPAPPPNEDPTSLTAVSTAILRHRREWKRGEAYVLLIALRQAGEPLVGRVAFGGVMRGVFQNAYLGYWVDAEHQSKGLMTEAVASATSFALGEARLHRVQAAVMPRNAASLRVLDKLGYRREGFAERYLCIAGTWEDHVIFATTAEEWNRSG